MSNDITYITCPKCGESVKAIKFTLETGNDRYVSAADYPQKAIHCSHCGFTGSWDVEFGWKSNFPIPDEVLRKLEVVP